MRTIEIFLGGLVAASLAFGHDARACGGCFQPPTVDSVVSGHRMAFAVSDERTVLWDQIQYTGNPGDFGWVLPVAPGAIIELSSDAWFEALESATSTRVTAPALKCVSGSGSGCFSLGSSDSASGLASAPEFGSNGVVVLHQAGLGPYETVTLRATDSSALRTWLSSHGYSIQEDVGPIIDAYIKENMDFIALRLHGDQPMQPVRVVTPSGAAVLPLRMVKAGTGDSVAMVLYAIGEQRLGLADLTEVHLDMSSLTFDFASSTTNYEAVRTDALQENLGASYLTTFAGKNPFGTQLTRSLTSSPNTLSATTLGQLYFDQGFQNEGKQATGCSLALRGLTRDSLVADADGAQQFTCGVGVLQNPLTDISAAMIGMHPSQLWLARLEMDLPRDVLGMDCRVNAASEQKAVSSDLVAVRAKNRPSFCSEPIFESRIARERTSPALAFAWAIAGMGILGLARRARRRC
jgi:hypothetical protein